MKLNPFKLGIACLLASAGFMTGAAHAVDFSFSGYGTLSYAQSNRSYNYQRFIKQGGTAGRDSVLGAQMDIELTPQFSATIQGRFAPSLSRENSWDPTITWAFLSWKPNDDWLVRAGKLRAPVYFNSENQDVSVTHDFARMPGELYLLSPAIDFTGVMVSRSFYTSNAEYTLEGMAGHSYSHVRQYLHEDYSPLGFPGNQPFYAKGRLDLASLVLTAQVEDHRFRIGVHRSRASADSPMVTDLPYVEIMPGVGFYDIANPLTADSVAFLTLMAGADVSLGKGWRVSGEYGRTLPRIGTLTANLTGYYLALQKQVGRWTSYVSYAAVHTSDSHMDMVRRINSNTVPDMIPLAPVINLSQRLAANATAVYDQRTIAAGVSYRLSPLQKIKAEIAHAKVGRASSFIDLEPGGTSANRSVMTYSLSYNFVF